MALRRAAAIVLCLGFLARAQDAGLDEQPLALRVGQSKEIDAGDAVGFVCDDLTVISAEAKDRTLIVFKGLKAGSTLCRVGIDFRLPHVFYRITVSP